MPNPGESVDLERARTDDNAPVLRWRSWRTTEVDSHVRATLEQEDYIDPIRRMVANDEFLSNAFDVLADTLSFAEASFPAGSIYEGSTGNTYDELLLLFSLLIETNKEAEAKTNRKQSPDYETANVVDQEDGGVLLMDKSKDAEALADEEETIDDDADAIDEEEEGTEVEGSNIPISQFKLVNSIADLIRAREIKTKNELALHFMYMANEIAVNGLEERYDRMPTLDNLRSMSLYTPRKFFNQLYARLQEREGDGLKVDFSRIEVESADALTEESQWYREQQWIHSAEYRRLRGEAWEDDISLASPKSQTLYETAREHHRLKYEYIGAALILETTVIGIERDPFAWTTNIAHAVHARAKHKQGQDKVVTSIGITDATP